MQPASQLILGGKRFQKKNSWFYKKKYFAKGILKFSIKKLPKFEDALSKTAIFVKLADFFFGTLSRSSSWGGGGGLGLPGRLAGLPTVFVCWPPLTLEIATIVSDNRVENKHR